MEDVIERVPGVGLGTDVIVGMPGEDDAAFENTVRLIDEFPFTNIHVFSFSAREGTSAYNMSDAVPPHVIAERSRILHRLADRKRHAFYEDQIGGMHRVFVIPHCDFIILNGGFWLAELVLKHLRVSKGQKKLEEFIFFICFGVRWFGLRWLGGTFPLSLNALVRAGLVSEKLFTILTDTLIKRTCLTFGYRNEQSKTNPEESFIMKNHN